MSVLLVLVGILNSLGLAYFSQFAGAIQKLGRALSTTGVGNGLQDAVTPPWNAKLALLNYAVTFALVGTSGYYYGIGHAAFLCGALFVAVLIWRVLLPRDNSAHFLTQIVGSMSARYANFVRDSDSARAAAMKDLLGRLEAYVEAGGAQNDWAGWRGDQTESFETAPQRRTSGNARAGASPMTNDVAAEVISAYANTMKNRKTLFGELSQLPYTKSLIKEAFVHGIKRSEGEMREHLKGAYVTLAEWQEGGGAYIDPSELAKSPQAIMTAALSHGFPEIPQKVATEATRLQAELAARGLV